MWLLQTWLEQNIFSTYVPGNITYYIYESMVKCVNEPVIIIIIIKRRTKIVVQMIVISTVV